MNTKQQIIRYLFIALLSGICFAQINVEKDDSTIRSLFRGYSGVKAISHVAQTQTAQLAIAQTQVLNQAATISSKIIPVQQPIATTQKPSVATNSAPKVSIAPKSSGSDSVPLPVTKATSPVPIQSVSKPSSVISSASASVVLPSSKVPISSSSPLVSGSTAVPSSSSLVVSKSTAVPSTSSLIVSGSTPVPSTSSLIVSGSTASTSSISSTRLPASTAAASTSTTASSIADSLAATLAKAFGLPASSAQSISASTTSSANQGLSNNNTSDATYLANNQKLNLQNSNTAGSTSSTGKFLRLLD